MSGRKKLKKQFKFRYFFIYVLTFILIWQLFGVFEFVESFKKFNNENIDLNSIDTVVVLTGSAGRLNLAYKLFKEHKINKLLISGTGSNVTYGILAKQYNWDIQDEENIVLDNFASSTMENAKNSYNKIMHYNVKNVCIVTSLLHMKRAALLFNWAFLDSNINLFYYVSNLETFDYDYWYEDSKNFKIIFSEYFKYEYYRFLILYKNIKRSWYDKLKR